MTTSRISKDCSQERRSPSIARLVFPVVAALLLASCASLNGAGKTESVATLSEPAKAKVLELAEEALEQSRYDEARNLIQKVLLKEAKDKKALMLWAEMLLATGLPQDSIEIFETHREDPKFSARANQGAGLALLHTGENEKAKERLDLAVKKDPALWRSWNALGFYHDSRQNWKLAAAAYDKAIKLNSKSALLYNNRGYSWLLQQKLEQAIKDFTTALSLDPRLKVAQINLRLAIAWTGQYERALMGSEKDELPRLLNNIGYVALIKGDLEAAEGLLLRSVEADATYNATARKNLHLLNSLKKNKS